MHDQRRKKSQVTLSRESIREKQRGMRRHAPKRTIERSIHSTYTKKEWEAKWRRKIGANKESRAFAIFLRRCSGENNTNSKEDPLNQGILKKLKSKCMNYLDLRIV